MVLPSIPLTIVVSSTGRTSLPLTLTLMAQSVSSVVFLLVQRNPSKPSLV